MKCKCNASKMKLLLQNANVTNTFVISNNFGCNNLCHLSSNFYDYVVKKHNDFITTTKKYNLIIGIRWRMKCKHIFNHNKITWAI
jgi:hypothetical protein